MNCKDLGIYIHIPFCVKKCNYCDFNSGPYSDEIKEYYIDALVKELKYKSQFFKDREIDTVFIGGGTPSILQVNLFSKMFSCLGDCYKLKKDAEISIESNPGTLDSKKLKAYKEAGINRISIGLQSSVDKELKILGRIHSYEDFLKSYDCAREAGFDNINVDLMHSIPGQTYNSFKSTLCKIRELNPEHISAYSLILEEGTPFFDAKLNLPDEEEDRRMVNDIPLILGDEYRQYEISNYSKKGFECRHNIKYWKRDDYLGFGVSAASLTDKTIRTKNCEDIHKYIEIISNGLQKDPKYPLELYCEYENLNEKDIIGEYIILGLRMNEGIGLSSFEKEFNKSVFELYGDIIKKHVSHGLLEIDKDNVRLTKKGRDLGNYVWADFLGD